MEKAEKLNEQTADASKVEQILEKNGIVDIRSFIQQTRNEVQTTRQDDPSSPSSPSGHDFNIYRLWLAMDKNGDGKVTLEDARIMLKELGFGFVSKHLAKTIFNLVDFNQNGELDFGDMVAFVEILRNIL